MDIDDLLAGLSDSDTEQPHHSGPTLVQRIEKALDAPEEFKSFAELDDLIASVYEKISGVYCACAPELAQIVPDKSKYCQIVEILGHDPAAALAQNFGGVAAIMGKQSALSLQLSRLTPLDSNVDLSLSSQPARLLAKKQMLLEKLSSKVDLAQNCLMIVEKSTLAQLFAYLGENPLEALAATPSANIPSLGSNKQRARQTGAAQQGILWNDAIFAGVDIHHMRSATRIVAGKLVLAARVDLSGSDSSQGRKWRLYIQERLDKLGAPPPNKLDRALPVPQEFHSKKRGGRRIRALKQKYAMSDLQKQNNRISFGVEKPVKVGKASAPSQLELSRKLREELKRAAGSG